jgi:hypothetical protein
VSEKKPWQPPGGFQLRVRRPTPEELQTFKVERDARLKALQRAYERAQTNQERGYILAGVLAMCDIPPWARVPLSERLIAPVSLHVVRWHVALALRERGGPQGGRLQWKLVWPRTVKMLQDTPYEGKVDAIRKSYNHIQHEGRRLTKSTSQN